MLLTGPFLRYEYSYEGFFFTIFDLSRFVLIRRPYRKLKRKTLG